MISTDVVGIASICVFVIGLPFNLAMISCIQRKPPATQTSLDLILIDTIYSNIMHSFMANYVVFLSLIFYPLAYQSAMLLSFVGNVLGSWAIASVLTMIGFKYLFICYSHIMMEKPDSMIRYGSILLKLCLIFIATILDHYGPIQSINSFFTLLNPDTEK